jgi:hypothetical protein
MEFGCPQTVFNSSGHLTQSVLRREVGDALNIRHRLPRRYDVERVDTCPRGGIERTVEIARAPHLGEM